MELKDLPVELFLQVISYFDSPSDFHALCLTSKALNTMCDSQEAQRELFLALFDPPERPQSDYRKLLTERVQVFHKKRNLEPDTLFVINQDTPILGPKDQDRVTVMDQVLKEMRNGGKNELAMKKLGALEYASRDHLGIQMPAHMPIQRQNLAHKTAFLILCSQLGPQTVRDRSWIKGTISTLIGEPEALNPQGAAVISGYGNIFSQCSQCNYSQRKRCADCESSDRLLDRGDPSQTFRGPECQSTPDWAFFSRLVQFLMFHMILSAKKCRVPSTSVRRPYVHLSRSSSNQGLPNRTTWCGVYFYVFRQLFEELLAGVGYHTDVYSDGTQICNIELLEDGMVIGHGKGTQSRAGGAPFTLQGTWTNLTDCPKGFKRVSFHKHYEQEQYSTHWLYDGIMIPGSRSPGEGLFLGRWRDDREGIRIDDLPHEERINGGFLFWKSEP